MTSLARTFCHPGPAAYPRVLAAEVRKTRELRVAIPAGANAGAALRELAAAHAIESGCGRIVCGSARALQYHVVIKASGGEKPYIYGEPCIDAGETTLVNGTFTLGTDRNGLLALHCHAAFVGSDGRLHGGHLILDRLTVGRAPLVVRISVFDGGGFVHALDDETRYTLFAPSRGGTA